MEYPNLIPTHEHDPMDPLHCDSRKKNNEKEKSIPFSYFSDDDATPGFHCSPCRMYFTSGGSLHNHYTTPEHITYAALCGDRSSFYRGYGFHRDDVKLSSNGNGIDTPTLANPCRGKFRLRFDVEQLKNEILQGASEKSREEFNIGNMAICHLVDYSSEISDDDDDDDDQDDEPNKCKNGSNQSIDDAQQSQ